MDGIREWLALAESGVNESVSKFRFLNLKNGTPDHPDPETFVDLPKNDTKVDV